MKPTLLTRKPVVELSNLDLRAFPIWEFALDEEGEDAHDETWVKPVNRTTIPLNSYSQIAAASFCGASPASVFNGFMMVTTKSHEMIVKGTPINLAGVSAGAIITESGLYLHIPVEARIQAYRTSMKTTRIDEDRNKLAKCLNVKINELFPLHYQLLVMVESEASFRKGTIA